MIKYSLFFYSFFHIASLFAAALTPSTREMMSMTARELTEALVKRGEIELEDGNVNDVKAVILYKTGAEYRLLTNSLYGTILIAPAVRIEPENNSEDALKNNFLSNTFGVLDFPNLVGLQNYYVVDKHPDGVSMTYVFIDTTFENDAHLFDEKSKTVIAFCEVFRADRPKLILDHQFSSEQRSDLLLIYKNNIIATYKSQIITHFDSALYDRLMSMTFNEGDCFTNLSQTEYGKILGDYGITLVNEKNALNKDYDLYRIGDFNKTYPVTANKFCNAEETYKVMSTIYKNIFGISWQIEGSDSKGHLHLSGVNEDFDYDKFAIGFQFSFSRLGYAKFYNARVIEKDQMNNLSSDFKRIFYRDGDTMKTIPPAVILREFGTYH